MRHLLWGDHWGWLQLTDTWMWCAWWWGAGLSLAGGWHRSRACRSQEVGLAAFPKLSCLSRAAVTCSHVIWAGWLYVLTPRRCCTHPAGGRFPGAQGPLLPIKHQTRRWTSLPSSSLSCPLVYRWGNWGQGRLKSLPKFTQPPARPEALSSDTAPLKL